MRIGIDARFLTHPQVGGFKTYTRQLVDALGRVDSRNEYVLYTDRAAALPRLGAAENFRVVTVPLRGGLFAMPLREQVQLPAQVRRDRLEVFHSPAASAPLRLDCPLVVTVHDAILFGPRPLAAPLRRNLATRYERFVVRRAVLQAAAIITVSQTSRDLLRRVLRVPAERLVVTYEAAADVYRVLPREEVFRKVRAIFGLGAGFVLALSSRDPRKNLDTLIAAHEALPGQLRDQFPLILAGGASTHNGASHLARKVRFLGPVSEQQLCLLYNAASLFAFPSLDEGFGLPPLEAMACGTPVIVAKTPAVLEVTGDAACQVDCNSPDTLGRELESLLRDERRRAALGRGGLDRAAAFSWDRCARDTLTAYELAART